MKTILPAFAALMLCGCAGVTPQQGLSLGLDLYCGALTEAARQAIRDQVTAGTPVVACTPDPASP